jgi:hypothetical protein
VTELPDDRVEAHGVRLYLKRDDLIHPEVPGNKWRKLKYNLTAAREQGYARLLTFGGAFSNHIRAVAAAGHYLGFATVGVIRGEEHQPLNESLAISWMTRCGGCKLRSSVRPRPTGPSTTTSTSAAMPSGQRCSMRSLLTSEYSTASRWIGCTRPR